MKNIADVLNERVVNLKSPIVVGLDPMLKRIPECYKRRHLNVENKFEAVGNVIFDFSKDIIDAVYEFVPAVKLQMAFYESYGVYGMLAFEKVVKYAKSKGMIVIEDGKRNDIGSTAEMYAKGHLGEVDLLNGNKAKSLDLDFLTVSPYLGQDSLDPFVKECYKNNKGIFILVKTSNFKSRYIQDVAGADSIKVYELIANYIAEKSKDMEEGDKYSPVGAVVGATYPKEARDLRKKMKKNIFLVPGYGVQGAKLEDIPNFFNEDGLGAIVNSSRGIIYSYETQYENAKCTKQEYIKTVKIAAERIRLDILSVLKNPYQQFKRSNIKTT